MTLPKLILYGGCVLFGIIALVGMSKKAKQKDNVRILSSASIATEQEEAKEKLDDVEPVDIKETVSKKEESMKMQDTAITVPALPESNLVDKLFVTDSSKLDVVETLTYTSRVPWLKGRPAWIADYSSHYETTRHFIARSLNKKIDYFTQKVSPGDRFNVLKKNINFYLLVDLSRCKMLFYVINKDTNKRTLLKTYSVGVGRKDETRESGSLTPIGKFTLGSKVAIYKSGTMGYFQDRKIEMMRIFGTRWIPFEKEIENCSEGAKGYGIHGAPWTTDEENNTLKEDRERVCEYGSDGCIRLFSEDIEELFAIIISKNTIIEIVKNFSDAMLPGEE